MSWFKAHFFIGNAAEKYKRPKGGIHREELIQPMAEFSCVCFGFIRDLL